MHTGPARPTPARAHARTLPRATPALSRGSIKMHKDRGGPLVMGPMWVSVAAVYNQQQTG
jgi:hypothetical protein